MRVRHQKGVSWPAVRHAWQAALAESALAPIETRVRHVQDGGIPIIVRTAEALRRKPRTKNEAPREDPFAPPYDPLLLVGEVGPAHVALLNKYPVLPEHVLLVTRDYANQRELLTDADFAAVTAVMRDHEVLGFYNGGAEGGASQAHKHLQAVPLPLGEDGEPVPLEPYLGRLPFLHSVVDLNGDCPLSPASLLLEHHGLWRACGFELEGERQPAPYNLLLTRRRMWLVPRRRQSHEGIEINSLGFAGALLARDQEQAALIERIGPLALLQQVVRE